MTAARKTIPPAVIQRLPHYLSYLREQKRQNADNAQYLYSHEIAYALGLTPSTVRQDFTYLDFFGRAHRGYRIDRTERVLSDVLDMQNEKRVVIVGGGNLGRALALHGNLGRYGFHVRGIVDVDSKIIGENVGDLTVQSMDNLVDVVQKERIDIGVIAVPANSAQHAADRLILAGIRGILNLAFTRVVSPRRVPVVDGRIVSSLLLLSHAMGHRSESQ